MAKYLFCKNYCFLKRVISPVLPFKRSVFVSKEDIARGSITFKSDNPFDLFNLWLKEASAHMVKPLPITFVLSTYSPEMKVTSRVFKFVSHSDDIFVFAGVSTTPKIKSLQKYPDVAMCFYWAYQLKRNYVIRQVRIEGTCKELPKVKSQEYFHKLPVPLQVEFFISRQDSPVKDWSQKQAEFLDAFKSVKDGKVNVPEYMTSFSVKVNAIQFFHNITKTEPFFMADRVKFVKTGDKWKPQRIAA